MPEAISVAVVAFPEIDRAVHAAMQTMQAGEPIARMELLDEVMIRAVNYYAGLAHSL